MAPHRLAALLLVASVFVCQVVVTLGFIAPKASVAVGSSAGEGFLGETLQEKGLGAGTALWFLRGRTAEVVMGLLCALGHGPTQGQQRSSSPLQRNPFQEFATLFWLGQPDRALWVLCYGLVASGHHDDPYAAPAAPTVEGKGVSSTVAAANLSGLDLCNRAIEVAMRPFLVSKLRQIESRGKPARDRSAVAAAAGGGGDGAAGDPLLINARRAAAAPGPERDGNLGAGGAWE
ncbi:hypothetical protein Esi_0086_0065 [Ectocarpus siliculosus]|uniref:Uncharacterized protein n=1 Tax=Ectocarpus siliculosus TaxID=2880 RepID=D7G803_ECTSI|nr:hypothetical protein Esi_0086_0065 [Ectocarpus siliculosus]|eukprot:CBJ27878.1 hypothetical protein Esi_0086_0065 [Ectocarpus siliculosus]